MTFHNLLANPQNKFLMKLYADVSACLTHLGVAHVNDRWCEDAERSIAKSYGGTRTGQYGGPDDVLVGDLFIVQSKVRGAFPEWMWAELQKLPRTGGRIPTLIISDRPANGVHARRLVVRLMSDDVALHGPKL